MTTTIWIVIAIVVVLAIVAFVVSRSRGQRVETHRAEAADLREEAAEHDRRLREQEAEATRARAQAQLAEADAQQQRLEAERLAERADHHSEGAAAVRSERDEQLRQADLRDPDVRTDDDGYRVDERGNRLPQREGDTALDGSGREDRMGDNRIGDDRTGGVRDGVDDGSELRARPQETAPRRDA